jgi:aryl-alcohol dehydrogenase-like predicted oxidoreductase
MKLGHAGPEVSVMGLGCMGMSGSYGEADDAESAATIRRALELGVTLFDTGDFYGDGHNERLVGTALGGNRDDVTIGTKTGVRRDKGGLHADGRPDYLRSACDASLERLGTDRIDVWTLARVDPDVAIEESIGAMAEMVAAGKVRHLGLSEASPETIRRAHAVHPIAALQTEYSLWQRHVEAEILPAVREMGIGFVAYSPLGRGFLAGSVRSSADLGERDFRRFTPRYQDENLRHNLRLLGEMEALAAEKHVTPAQLALAWVHAQGNDLVSIPGTKHRSRLEENVAALDVELSADDLVRIEAALPPGAAAGDRYPEAAMRGLQE